MPTEWVLITMLCVIVYVFWRQYSEAITMKTTNVGGDSGTRIQTLIELAKTAENYIAILDNRLRPDQEMFDNREVADTIERALEEHPKLVLVAAFRCEIPARYELLARLGDHARVAIRLGSQPESITTGFGRTLTLAIDGGDEIYQTKRGGGAKRYDCRPIAGQRLRNALFGPTLERIEHLIQYGDDTDDEDDDQPRYSTSASRDWSQEARRMEAEAREEHDAAIAGQLSLRARAERLVKMRLKKRGGNAQQRPD